MTTTITQTGLTELISRMSAYPDKFKAVMGVTMEATLLTLWENVLPYPIGAGHNTSGRQGTLGRSLGSSEGGGKSGGEPSIYEVKELGAFGVEGRFGTNLEYAEQVIGDEGQAWPWSEYWWQMKDVAARATEKIDRLWLDLAAQMAAFLDRK